MELIEGHDESILFYELLNRINIISSTYKELSILLKKKEKKQEKHQIDEKN